jgi:hypothetical protein
MPPQHVRQRAAAAELSAPRLTVWLRDRVTGQPRRPVAARHVNQSSAGVH